MGIGSSIQRRPRVRGHVLSWFGVVLLSSLLLIAVFGSLLPLGSAEEIGAGPRLAGPSSRWPAGTDNLGRSQLPRLAQGLHNTLVLAGTSVAVTAAVGVALGMLAGYYRGFFGEAITRAADVLFAFPALLLAILVVAISGPGATGAVISIALICSPLMIRVVRVAVLSVAERDFVIAARVGGARSSRILVMHVLPNIAGVAVVQATYAMSVGMLIESTLSFLGLGIQPPSASLGSLVRDGSVYLSVAPWLTLIPGILLALTILSVNLVGDALRDLLSGGEGMQR